MQQQSDSLEKLKRRKAEIREYNRRVMPCAKDFLTDVVAETEKVFGKVRIERIQCNGHEWKRGYNNDRATPCEKQHRRKS